MGCIKSKQAYNGNATSSPGATQATQAALAAQDARRESERLAELTRNVEQLEEGFHHVPGRCVEDSPPVSSRCHESPRPAVPTVLQPRPGPAGRSPPDVPTRASPIAESPRDSPSAARPVSSVSPIAETPRDSPTAARPVSSVSPIAESPHISPSAELPNVSARAVRPVCGVSSTAPLSTVASTATSRVPSASSTALPWSATSKAARRVPSVSAVTSSSIASKVRRIPSTRPHAAPSNAASTAAQRIPSTAPTSSAASTEAPHTGASSAVPLTHSAASSTASPVSASATQPTCRAPISMTTPEAETQTAPSQSSLVATSPRTPQGERHPATSSTAPPPPPPPPPQPPSPPPQPPPPTPPLSSENDGHHRLFTSSARATFYSLDNDSTDRGRVASPAAPFLDDNDAQTHNSWFTDVCEFTELDAAALGSIPEARDDDNGSVVLRRPELLPPPLPPDDVGEESNGVENRAPHLLAGVGSFAQGFVESIRQPIESGDPLRQRGGVGNEMHNLIQHFARGLGTGLDRVMTMDGVSETTLSRLGTMRGAVSGVARGNLRNWTGNVTNFMASHLGAAWDLMSSGLTDDRLNRFLREHIYDVPANEKADFCCAICTDGVVEGGRRDFKVVRMCGAHDFHFGCLREWLKRKNNCPLCRRPDVVPADIMPAVG